MIIHLLQYGHTACLIDDPPGDWPEDHRWSAETAEVTCRACLESLKWGGTTYELIDSPTTPGGRAIRCRRCGTLSHNPHDVTHHYCNQCAAFHDDIWPPARLTWLKRWGDTTHKLIYCRRCGVFHAEDDCPREALKTKNI
jgi:hypothetical protein